jgi:hypothetical protein
VAVTPLSVPARLNANGVCGPPVFTNPYSGSGRVVSAKSTSTSTVALLTWVSVTVPTLEGWTPWLVVNVYMGPAKADAADRKRALAAPMATSLAKSARGR